MLNFKKPYFHHLREPKIITRLHILREARGFSGGYLAQKSGIPINTLRKYEYGNLEIEDMSVKNIVNLCLALDCKVKDLLPNPNGRISQTFSN